jgi:hypothetical protein
MPDPDIASLWRTMRANPTDVPRVGAHLETPAPGITISVSQECLTTLPRRRFGIPEASVTVTSQRPGVPGQVTLPPTSAPRTAATKAISQRVNNSGN